MLPMNMAGTIRNVNALPIRVAVLSPQAVVVEGLRAILATNDDVKFVDLNGDETTPDLVLYDAMCLLGGDSTELDSMVHETSTAVLVVSRDLRPGLAAQALAAGADGLVSVGACPDEIFESIRTALTGRRLRDADRRPGIDTRPPVTRENRRDGLPRLTQREAQVLAMLGRGQSNAEIAGTLQMSRNTIKTHIRMAYRKIGVKDRAEAIVWARAHQTHHELAT